jgi:hypothetical protein
MEHFVLTDAMPIIIFGLFLKEAKETHIMACLDTVCFCIVMNIICYHIPYFSLFFKGVVDV